MGRLFLLAALVTALAGAPRGAPAAPLRAPAAPDTALVDWVAPLTGAMRVLRLFDPPATPYGPGHLGVDLGAGAGTRVRSAGPGVVTFAGSVAGRGVVVVLHPDGIRTEYEPLRVVVRRGAAVAGGQVIGVVAGPHRSCGDVSCLHWGARRDEVYLDPLALLRPLAPVRLLPWPRAG